MDMDRFHTNSEALYKFLDVFVGEGVCVFVGWKGLISGCDFFFFF